MSALRAGIYTRLSSDVAGDRLGVDRQERECRALAESVQADVVRVYSDNDVSAYAKRRRRPGYERLLDDVGTGFVDLLIAWHPDRLYRRQADLVRLIDTVQSANAQIATVTAGGLDLTSASGRMFARVVGAVSEHESDRKSERIRVKHDELALRGRWSGGRTPFGYRYVGDGRLEVEPREAELVREAAARVLAGESVSGVCRDFNRRDIATKRGGLWQQPSLKNILTNPTITGRRLWKGDLIDGAWEALIDPKTGDELRGALLDQRRRHGQTRPVALFVGGLIRCGVCDAVLRTGGKGDKYRLYRCKPPPEGRGCGATMIYADPTERFVVAALLDRLSGPDGAGSLALLGYSMSLQRQLRQNHQGRRMLQELHSQGEMSRAEWLTARRRLRSAHRLMLDRARLAHQPLSFAGIPPSLADATSSWDESSMSVRRRVMSTVIERIVISPANQTGSACRFAPERVQDGIAWATGDDE